MKNTVLYLTSRQQKSILIERWMLSTEIEISTQTKPGNILRDIGTATTLKP